MNGPVRLSLYIGPAVPVPVPQTVLDALQSVQVSTTAQRGKASGFQLAFSVSKNSPLATLFLVTGSVPIPLVRVVISVTLNGQVEVLMDGIMTDHQLSPGSGGGPSTLTISGQDLSAIMNYLPLDGVPYPAMPPEARVAIMLAKYAFLGVIPMVIPSVLLDVPIPVDQIPRQQGTDLQYINQLANDVGYTFYMVPGPAVGTSVAYWGPDIKVGVPQPALNVDMDALTNVESLSFRYESDKAALPLVIIQEPNSKSTITIPVPSVTPLSPPLGAIPPIPMRFPEVPMTAKLSPVRALLIGLALAAQSGDVLHGTGKLDVLRYGRVLKARQLVGVRGAGDPFDGLHYVDSVTHELKRGEYKQNFTLSRNGLISTLPRVPV